jgi:hypothetical protein
VLDTTLLRTCRRSNSITAVAPASASAQSSDATGTSCSSPDCSEAWCGQSSVDQLAEALKVEDCTRYAARAA